MIRAFIIISLFGLVGFESGEFGRVDIHYNFESVDIDSGPDTFELFEESSSEVSLSSQYAFRGAYSLHVQDYIENGSFPEFQGYFPKVSGGVLEIGFALMTPSPEEPFNVALAGDSHFRMTQNGIGFWLFNDSGTLRHMSDSIPKRLFELTPFKWYWFEVELDLSKGEYSLVVKDEFDTEIINLSQQAHPTSAKSSNLLKYSFAGDLADKGGASLYVDEFVLRTAYADSPQPMVAPGRRSLFVDKWDQYHRKTQSLDFCLPPKLPYDFIDIYNVEALSVLQGNVDALRVLLSSPTQQTLLNFEHDESLIIGIAEWAQGCLKLKERNYAQAITHFLQAQRVTGNSPAIQLSLAIAYAKSGQIYGAKEVISRGQVSWPNDVRWLVLLAAIGFTSNQIQESEHALSGIAHSLDLNRNEVQVLMQEVGWLRRAAVSKLKSEFVWPDSSEEFIIAEQYYFALLWQSRYREAKKFADNFNRLLKRHKLESPLWIERAADAALLARSLRAAENEYKKVLELEAYNISALQKLADVYFLQGHVDKEREVRESIFGALNYE